MLVKFGCLVFSLCLVVGCASTSHFVDEKAVVILDAHAPEVDAKHSLYEKQVYQILLAETAYQRGELRQAVDGYLSVALESHDSAVAERACYMALNADDKDAGLQVARHWVDFDPENVKARYFLVLFYMQNGQIELVQQQLKRTLSMNGGEGDRGFFGVAELLAGELDGADALFVMKGLVADFPEDVDALVAQSQLALRVGEVDEALSTVTHARRLMPDRVDALLLQVRILQMLGNHEAAAEHLLLAIDRHPDDLKLRKWYAQVLEASGRKKEAVVQFKIIDSQSPMDSDVVFSLGMLELDSGNRGLAKGYMQRLLEAGVFSNEANYYMGWLAELEDAHSEAIDFYSAVNLGDAYFDAQIRLAYNTAQLGDLNAARGYLESVEPVGVEEIERVFLVQGELLRDAKKFEDAIEVYGRGLRQLPGHNELLYARAMVAEKAGHKEQMKQDLEEIIASNPKDIHALNALGYALIEQGGDLYEAEEYLLRALKLDPKSYYIIDSVGWLYFHLGEYEKAEEYLRRAYGLEKDAEVAAHLGEVLWVTGDYKGAKAIWEQALKDAPEHKVLLGIVERFSER